jgi:CPA1 family monovalent cation:H+ antiporter
LLYSAAWTTSWRDFRYNIVTICLLAFGLVGFTVLGVALAAPTVLSGFDWRLGMMLGAIVAPTDAIAATSIARRGGLPRRIVDILEGESLINDATGLLALQFATEIVVSRHVPSLSTGFLTLAWLVLGGVGLGLLTALIVDYVERKFDDGPIEIALSVLVPYAVYLAADAVHASGVLAVVACGLLVSRRSVYFFSPAVRIQAWSFWASFTFVLNGVVFVLIGLQLFHIRSSIREYSLASLLFDGVTFSLLIILLRLAWAYPGAGLSWLIQTKIRKHKEKPPGARQIFVVGWTGMRGVVSLAAALALPQVLENGSPFWERNLIIFLTFCVIFVTLVLQGITLPPLIRALKLAGTAGPNCEELEARRIVLEAAVSHLEESKAKDREEAAGLYEDLAQHYRQRLVSLRPVPENEAALSNHDRYVELSREALRVERETVVSLWNQGRINDDVLRRIERELDLSESRFLLNES